MTMQNVDLVRVYAVLAECIPQEMVWAYESVRESGIWNMNCFHPSLGRYAGDADECLKVMDEAYLRFCAYTHADLSDKKYVHMTKDHVRCIQQCYDICSKSYPPKPEGVVNVTAKITTEYNV